MIGASCCCHVTLLILLLVLRLTFANINTPSISSSPSLSLTSSTISLTYPLPQSTSLGSSSKGAASSFRISSSAPATPSSQVTNNPSESQSNDLLVSNDQSEHNKSPESPLQITDSQSNTVSNSQSQYKAPPHDLALQIAPPSVVMQTISSPPAVDQIARKPMQFKNDVKRRLEEVILKVMGLNKIPKIDQRYAVPEYMLKLYDSQKVDDRRHLQMKGNGPIAANTVRSFVHTDIDSRSCQSPTCYRVHFDIETIPENEKIVGAEFRVFVDNSPQTWDTNTGRTSSERNVGDIATLRSRTPFRIEVHEIMRPDSVDGDVISRLIDTQVVSYGNPTWHSFDIRPAVLRWKRAASSNHGLEVRLVAKAKDILVESHVRLRQSHDIEDNVWERQRPLLVAFASDESATSTTSKPSKVQKRYRRQVADKDNKNKKRNRKKKHKKRRKKKGNKHICKRHDLFVNFNDVGWDDWIVAPPGYSAYYCQGDCMAPLPDFTKASNHAMLQARVYKVHPNSVPMVCCVPSKMSSISMLYRDEKGRTVLKNYQDMAVVECSCK